MRTKIFDCRALIPLRQSVKHLVLGSARRPPIPVLAAWTCSQVRFWVTDISLRALTTPTYCNPHSARNIQVRRQVSAIAPFLHQLHGTVVEQRRIQGIPANWRLIELPPSRAGGNSCFTSLQSIRRHSCLHRSADKPTKQSWCHPAELTTTDGAQSRLSAVAVSNSSRLVGGITQEYL